jgi:uncharacterized protein YcaQ
VSKLKNVTLEVARRFTLSKQMLLQPVAGESIQEVADVVKRLGGVQYDPLPVVEKAHYLTLWNRVKNFRKQVLDDALYKERRMIEFVLMRQALHIVPVEELPYYYQAVQRVFRRGWIQKAIDKLARRQVHEIVERIKSHGVVSSKDFPYGRLRALFYKGEIAIANREAGIFQMPYYCLLNTLHPGLDLQAVDEETAQKWLIMKTISAYGIASARHISYWTGYKVKETEDVLNQLKNEDAVRRVKMVGLKGYQWVTAEDFDEIGETEKGENVVLLSPMDNLTRDRKWLHKVFGYSFSIEYFQKKGMRWQISILWGTRFLGFIDAKMDRPRRTFILKELAVHSEAQKDVWMKIINRIVDFARFHRAKTIAIGVKCPKWLSSLFRKLGYEHKANLVTI